jgi:hypothetical protein
MIMRTRRPIVATVALVCGKSGDGQRHDNGPLSRPRTRLGRFLAAVVIDRREDPQRTLKSIVVDVWAGRGQLPRHLDGLGDGTQET